MKRRLRTLVSSTWFKLVLSVALLVFLMPKTDIHDLGRVFAKTHLPWLIAAFVGYEISQVMSALRWWLLGRPLGFHDSFSRYLVCYFSGMYLNLFAPSTVAGDVGRALFLAGGRRRTLAFTSVIADRGIGFIALIWVNAAAILLLPGYPIPRLMRLAAWLVPPATVALWLWGPRLAVSLLPPTNRWRVLVEVELARYWSDARLLAVSFALAVCFHLVQIGTQVLIAWGLGLAIPWAFFLIFVPAANIAGMLPISMSGVGVREALYIYFLSRVGVDREAALALGLLSSAVVLLTGLSSAPVFVLLKSSRSPRPEEEEATAS